MKIPKQIKIGPHIYQVRFEEDFTSNHGILGQSRHVPTTIILDPRQSDTQLLDTFIHEILHCLNEQVEFVGKDRDTEEAAVSRIAPLLLQIIQDNPEIFEKGKHGKK